MYRYSVDNAVTYTCEDFVLFRESPFACWMERLSLENPEHGIPPDVGSLPPGDSIEPQDDMADTLRSEDKDVRLIDWDADEPERRSATLDAMRKGADFIVNGQLALGPLSGAANLLVRTSGYSELGDFLYIPCDTQPRSNLHSEFRLCFLADLLHSLQGQLPPQMLVIRGGDDLMPLETESHIYHYRAVKQRFMASMRGFRKHRMPDPAESAHFGRWSDCAHEVLKQRLLGEEQVGEEITDEDYQEPVLKAASAAAGGDATLDLEHSHPRASEHNTTAPVVSAGLDPAASTLSVNTSGFTLAEQAHMLAPGRYRPGPGVYRLGRPRAPQSSPADSRAVPGSGSGKAASVIPDETCAKQEFAPPAPETAAEEKPRYNRRASDKALQNLEFIGSSVQVSGMVLDTPQAPEAPSQGAAEQDSSVSTAPAPSLRDPRSRGAGHDDTAIIQAPDAALGADTPWALPAQEEVTPVQQSDIRPEAEAAFVSETAIPTPAEIASQIVRPSPATHPAIDMDGTHLGSPRSSLPTSERVPADGYAIDDQKVEHGFGQAAGDKRKFERTFSDSLFRSESQGEGKFSDSLITSDDFED